jgi:hypothetical protein
MLAFPDSHLPEEALSDIELELVSGSGPSAWLGLTTASRPADVPMTIGWFARSDGFSAGIPSPGQMTAVLPSWEDSFGAFVFRLGSASLQLLVQRPPEPSKKPSLSQPSSSGWQTS